MLDKGAVKEYTRRLLLSRMRILDDYGFYGLLLMHVIFAVDEELPTAATDGVRITFGTSFLESLSDDELDIVMMHEILHIVLFHVLRGAELESERFNIACDIVVNSNIMLEKKLPGEFSLKEHGELMHKAPNGREGFLHTAEEVYEMLPQGAAGAFFDDHSRWGSVMEDSSALRDVWVTRITNAAEAISIQNSVKNRGTLPAFAKRLIEQLRGSQIDWRAILNDFIQEEINDYSFMPPDRRFDDSPFYLPDFNEKEEEVRNILFMIDTSGSMTELEIAAAYSEIRGALEQFNGKLAGWLGFFDAAIIEPVPFESVGELQKIEPAGGGGTDFDIIFDYVATHMTDEPPVSIIILTDGYAPFPQEKAAMGIPVLWLLNNALVDPPWGKVARIDV